MDTLSKWISKPMGAIECIPSSGADTDISHVLHPIDTVVGHEQASVGCHVWVIWWARQSLELHTPLIFFFLTEPMLSNSMVLIYSVLYSFPWSLLPPSLLYNLWVLFLLVTIGALGMRNCCSSYNAHNGRHWQVDGPGCALHFTT